MKWPVTGQAARSEAILTILTISLGFLGLPYLYCKEHLKES
jgi:hypothetical protein